jgi:hypothetical protein
VARREGRSGKNARVEAMVRQRQDAGAKVSVQESWRAPNVMWLSSRVRPDKPTQAQRRAEAEAREAVLQHVYDTARWWWSSAPHANSDQRKRSHAQLLQLIVESSVQNCWNARGKEKGVHDDLYAWMARWLLHTNPAHADATAWPHVPRMGHVHSSKVVEGEAHMVLTELTQLGKEDISLDPDAGEPMDVLWAAFEEELTAMGERNPKAARKWTAMDAIPHVKTLLERYLVPLRMDVSDPRAARDVSEAIIQGKA